MPASPECKIRLVILWVSNVTFILMISYREWFTSQLKTKIEKQKKSVVARLG